MLEAGANNICSMEQANTMILETLVSVCKFSISILKQGSRTQPTSNDIVTLCAPGGRMVGALVTNFASMAEDT